MGLTNEEAAEQRAVRASGAALEADRALRYLRRDLQHALNGDDEMLRRRVAAALGTSLGSYA